MINGLFTFLSGRTSEAVYKSILINLYILLYLFD